jgi:hypothetical protein
MFEHHTDSEVFTQAACWGADQELQECINFIHDNELCDPNFYKDLLTARRPKLPTIKEQALSLLSKFSSNTGIKATMTQEDIEIIRSALKQINDCN